MPVELLGRSDSGKTPQNDPKALPLAAAGRKSVLPVPEFLPKGLVAFTRQLFQSVPIHNDYSPLWFMITLSSCKELRIVTVALHTEHST